MKDMITVNFVEVEAETVVDKTKTKFDRGRFVQLFGCFCFGWLIGWVVGWLVSSVFVCLVVSICCKMLPSVILLLFALLKYSAMHSFYIGTRK